MLVAILLSDAQYTCICQKVNQVSCPKCTNTLLYCKDYRISYEIAYYCYLTSYYLKYLILDEDDGLLRKTLIPM